MTSEHKLSLIIGVTVVLLVFVLLTDHMSSERNTPLAAVGQEDSLITDDLLPSQPIQLVDMTGTGQQRQIGVHYNAPTSNTRALSDAHASGSQIRNESPAESEEPNESDRSSASTRMLATAGELGDRFADAIKGSLENAQPASQTDRVAPQGASEAERLLVAPPQETRQTTLAQHDDPAIFSMDPKSRFHPAGEKSANEMVDWEFRTVRKNESLYAIAEEYYGNGNEWRRIAEFNADKVSQSGSVKQGVKLRVPLGTNLVIAKAEPKLEQPASKPVDSAKIADAHAAKTRAYVVKKNDTLGHIAQRELGSVRFTKVLLETNGLKKNDVIVAGMTLQIPIQ
ncbi:MAG: LysM peptidoglycan-binding domain-containing protein [Phycisphaeraceae bacterium]|nr:LysM peptidoglycan-binding domain-containing protein [Phycisphaerales bacterium]MCB9859190.1 LysM peptidoglycan-binding domain-containing protein [Phycisphaeraceae bacterium]